MTQAYVRPDTLEGALSALAEAGEGARVLAGGTDLMIHVRAGKRFPALVNVSRVPELQAVRVVEGGHLELGAGVTVARLLRDPVIRQRAPLLWQAADHFASPLVRSRATLGGNLINASPAADLTLALLALDAQVQLASSREGPRSLRIDELILGPGKTALRQGELVTSVRVPLAGDRFHRFEKSGPRPALEISVAAVAVALGFDGGKVLEPRIACGAVAPFPLRAAPAEEAIAGRALTPETIDQAARAAAQFVRPIDDVRASALYRRRLVAAFVRRCLTAALDSSRVLHATGS